MTPAGPGASSAQATALQAGLFDFALGELVRQHRTSFPPLWTTESWAKLMIWLALNCGADGSREGLESFAAAIGPHTTGRMRRLFFERELEALNLKLMADPAEAQVLALPLEPAGGEGGLVAATLREALEQVGLAQQVSTDPHSWVRHESVVAIPWARQISPS
ncbi:MAG: protein phosphatase [Cyanobacteria bacterium]|nr:protein phosphatase [Cyanobacteriota bacterium]